MKILILYSILIVGFCSVGFAQGEREQVFELLAEFEKEPTDTGKVNILNEISTLIRSSDFESSKEYSDKAIKLAKLVGYKKGLAKAYLNTGVCYYYQYQFDSTIYYYEKAKSIYVSIGDKTGESNIDNNIGLIHHIQSNFSQAIMYYQKSLQVREEIGNLRGTATSYMNIGAIYALQSHYDLALENYFKSLRLADQIQDTALKAGLLANIGAVYLDQDNFEKALEYYFQGNEMYGAISNKRGLADTYRNIGNVFESTDRLDSAFTIYQQALDIYNDLGDLRGVVVLYNYFGSLNKKMYELKLKSNGRSDKSLLRESRKFYVKSMELNQESVEDMEELCLSYYGLGTLSFKEEDYAQAIVYFNKALDFADEADLTIELMRTNQILSNAYMKLGSYKKAYEAHVAYKQFSDSAKSDENVELITQMSMQYEFDKQQEMQKMMQAQREMEYLQKQKRDKMIRGFIIVVLVIVSGFSIQVLRSYQRKKKDNILLAQQKEEIEKQKQEITDSIKYAKRIQTAILPHQELAEEILPEHFILFRPRDIVSGDYYWMNKVDNKVVVVAADCTGHGVPGAFMSMLGVSFLNEIVNKGQVVESHTILNQLRARVKKTLGQTGKEGEAKDGMDIALCVIDFDKMEMEYSGAYNPLYLYRQGELIEYKADKMPIGIYIREKESFTKNVIPIEKGDTFYIFSDGYVDQFGGENGSKYKSKPFKRYLAGIQEYSMEEQRKMLNDNFEQWKGDIEQIDDVILLGIRV